MTTIQEITETVRTEVRRTHTQKAADRILCTILTESICPSRRYYSLAAMLIPCDNAAEDICIAADITNDGEQAEYLFRLIADGCVTPCTLTEVLSDLLA